MADGRQEWQAVGHAHAHLAPDLGSPESMKVALETNEAALGVGAVDRNRQEMELEARGERLSLACLVCLAARRGTEASRIVHRSSVHMAHFPCT